VPVAALAERRPNVAIDFEDLGWSAVQPEPPSRRHRRRAHARKRRWFGVLLVVIAFVAAPLAANAVLLSIARA
jgi:hypothetical protein